MFCFFKKKNTIKSIHPELQRIYNLQFQYYKNGGDTTKLFIKY